MISTTRLARLAIPATLILLCGCASEDKTVTVGEPGQKGTYKRGIDGANDVAGKATENLQQGEKDVYGK